MHFSPPQMGVGVQESAEIVRQAITETALAAATVLDSALIPEPGGGSWVARVGVGIPGNADAIDSVLTACRSEEMAPALYRGPGFAQDGEKWAGMLRSAHRSLDPGRRIDPDDAHFLLTACQLLLGALGLSDASARIDLMHRALPVEEWASESTTDGEHSIQLAVLAMSTVSYASANSRIPLLHAIRVQNTTGDELAAKLVIEATTPTGPIADRLTVPLTLRPGMNPIDVARLDFALDPEAMYSIDEQRRGKLTVTVLAEGLEPSALSRALTVQAPRQWWSRGWDAAVALLAAFVMPNDPALAPVLSRAADLLGERTGSSALEGYQAESAQRIDDTVNAVFDALRERDIAYANPPASWSDEGQKIRTPTEVIVGRLGTCLDTTVTLAAALEAVGIRSFPVLVQGHAFLGYWREPKSFETPALMDIERMRSVISADEVAFVETTVICRLTEGEHQPWDVVQKRPLIEHFDSRPGAGWFQGATDVYVARRSGVIPLPSVTTDAAGNRHVVIYQPSAPTAPEVEAVVAARQPRVVGDVPPRLGQWKNALLDLSLRNRLINLGKGTNDVRLVVPGDALPRLEDLMNSGKAMVLDAADNLSGIKRVGGVATASRLGHDELVSTLERGTLFTDLSSDAYLSRLRSLAYRARTIVQETGANNLYLSFGTLVWDIDGREIQSPLVLVPVRLEIAGRGKAYRLVLDEAEESTPNFCLLEKLKQVHGIRVPGLENPVTDASGIDLEAAFAATREAMGAVDPRYRVEPEVRLSILQFGKFRLWKDLDEHWQTFTDNALVKHLVDTPTEEFVDPIGITPSIDLDALNALCPLPTDGSQLEAIADALYGRTFVLEGPPGTGKSQTITNMLARLVAEGKRVLFVAEKGEAIKVVQKRLNSVGVGSFCLNVHDKSMRPAAVRAQLLAALDRAVESDDDALQVARRGLTASGRTLARYAANVHSRNRAGHSLYGARLRQLAADPDLPVMPMPEDLAGRVDAEQTARVERALEDLPEAIGGLRMSPDSPWRFIEAKTSAINLDALVASAIELDALLASMDVSKLALAAAARTVADWRIVAGVLSAPSIDSSRLEAARGPAWQQSVDSYLEAARAVGASATTALPLFTPAVMQIDLAATHAEAGRADASGFFGRKNRQLAAFEVLRPTLVPGAVVRPADVTGIIGELAGVQARIRELRDAANTLPGVALPLDWNPLMASGISQLESQLSWTTWLAAAAAGESALAGAVRTHLAIPRSADLTLAPLAGQIVEAFDRVVSAGAVDEAAFDAWLGAEGLQARWGRARSERRGAPVDSSLRSWHRVLSLLDPLYDIGATEGRRLILDGRLLPDDAAYAFAQGLAESSVPERLPATGLDSFDALAHEASVNRYGRNLRTLRELLTTAVPEEILSHRKFAAGSTSGQIGALRRELERQRGGLTVRALLTKYAKVITHITPCMMMSPDSVARFLPAQAGLFDVVVFDEASQVRVADAIGAMGRATSVIVVGDSEQMPPTSFAESTGASVAGDEHAEEEAEIIADQESILTECTQARVHRRMLTWHYRSQDEALIAFSNEAYYKGALSSFPTPSFGTKDDSHSGFGISLRPVIGGEYHRGRGAGRLAQTNIPEAQAVVDEVQRRFAASRDVSPSLGIVTFNLNQRKLIDTMLRDIGDPRIIESLESDDGLFVKNLENVQGDERDTIFFSVGRAADERGVVPLNFGPLNLQGGHRRLNVAITRARRQVVMFCSFKPHQLPVEKSNSRGVKDLGQYLSEAERGSHTALDNPLRVAVNDKHRDEIAEQLERRGYVVRRDIGLSSFRIDLSVATANAPDKPVAAVLLDGPGWAQRRTVADRDALPGDILTDMMHWPVVARVWLPEWLASPGSAVDRLAARIDAAATGMPADSEEKDEPESERDEQPSWDAGEVASLEADGRTESQMQDAEYVGPQLARASTSLPSEVQGGRLRFREWKWTPGGTIDDLDALPAGSSAGRVVRTIEAVVAAEGPVHFSRVVKEVASAFGLSKVATKRSDALLALIPRELVPVPSESFAWPRDVLPESYSSYRVPHDDLLLVRAVDVIHWRELVNAMADIARSSMGVERESLKRETLAVFGWKRLTEGASATLDLAVDSGIGAGLLSIDSSGLLQPVH